MSSEQQQSALEEVMALGPDSTAKEILDAGEKLAEVHIERMKYEFAWRKVGFLLQWQQAKHAKSLTWGTWGLAIATWVLAIATLVLVYWSRSQ